MSELFGVISEFFRGWRRKAGFASLVIALFFAGWWVRSLCVTDYIVMTSGSGDLPSKWSSTGAWSLNGCLYWERFAFGLLSYNQEPANEWGCTLNGDQGSYGGHYRVSEFVTDSNVELSWRLFGCGVGVPKNSRAKPAKKAAIVVISHWVIVAPLTVTSAFFLLFPLRKANGNRIGRS